MRAADPQARPAPPEPCLVHHFIRTHGRRPDPDEMAVLLGDVPPAVPFTTSVASVPPWHPPAPGDLVRALRREMARLITRG